MRKIAVLLSTLALVISSAAHAAWSGQAWVKSMVTSDFNGEGVWVTFDNDPHPGHTCSIRTGEYKLGGSEDNVERMSVAARDSLLLGRAVRVYWDGGCSDGGTSGYPVLVGLWLT